MVTSIAPIEKKYKTSGSNPFLILASDFEYYVCKYPRYPKDTILVKEFLGQRFARRWGIKVPEMVSINVLREHIPENMLDGRLNYINLDKPIIGFKLIPNVTELMDNFASGIERSELKKYNKEDFLNIALFDCWLSNEDRNHNNTNILIEFKNQQYSPIAIDHETIFNSGFLDKDIYELSYEDSLLYTALYSRILPNSEISVKLIQSICTSFQNKVGKCYTNLEEVITEIPENWVSDKQDLYKRLQKNIFTEEWLKKVEFTFRSFASLTLKK
ncbi:MAG: hypothetical protein LAT68_00540 [Cyclobacteriaceae bacterium]|nr:hypothetical protein [Cyclobacteriaceae bacterium]MCH8514790.1 hypothetical protein [Cyclobacteriaceae bacterium]